MLWIERKMFWYWFSKSFACAEIGTWDRQAVQLPWHVSPRRGEGKHHGCSEIWQHERQQIDQLYQCPFNESEGVSFHEKRYAARRPWVLCQLVSWLVGMPFELISAFWRESWRPEESFHRGPEWAIWWALQAAHLFPWTGVSHWSLRLEQFKKTGSSFKADDVESKYPAQQPFQDFTSCHRCHPFGITVIHLGYGNKFTAKRNQLYDSCSSIQGSSNTINMNYDHFVFVFLFESRHEIGWNEITKVKYNPKINSCNTESLHWDSGAGTCTHFLWHVVRFAEGATLNTLVTFTLVWNSLECRAQHKVIGQKSRNNLSITLKTGRRPVMLWDMNQGMSHFWKSCLQSNKVNTSWFMCLVLQPSNCTCSVKIHPVHLGVLLIKKNKKQTCFLGLFSKRI